jgi:hypothetical protein
MAKTKASVKAASTGAVTFTDRRYKERTIIGPSGTEAIVTQHHVTTDDQEMIEFLDRHAHFERVGA